MLKTNLESCAKYIVVSKFLGKEYTLTFDALDKLADYVAIERGLVGVYRVLIIELPAGVYTRKTESHG